MLKEDLKKNETLRRLVKKIKIKNEYKGDAKEYCENYLEEAEKRGRPEYRIMLLVHSLEKGMCMPDPRPFGFEKAYQLKEILASHCKRNDLLFEYELGLSILMEWVRWFDVQGWEKNEVVTEIEEFLDGKKTRFKAGSRGYPYPEEAIKSGLFTDLILSRHSVRDFREEELKDEDIEYALKMFVATPTACNRQMCRVYQIKDKSIKKKLEKTILGISGFNKNAMHYFIITFDISAFDFFGERNQGYFNAGLAAMNFVNALHARGIGSCFMQWANKRYEDESMRAALRLDEGEKIAVVIGAGYYKDDTIIPCSVRRNINDVYLEI